MSKKTNSSEPNIVRYQTERTEFEYARFWDSRSYEDSAERLLLNSWLRAYPQTAQWLVDVGGSFGRLLPTYADRFKSLVILDYATNEFHLAQKVAKNSDLDVQFIAANVYHLPLADNSQLALVAIRIVHHLEEPDKFFSEVSRVLAPGGVAVIEVANKNHLKLLLRSVARLDFKAWRSAHKDIGASGVQADESFTLIRAYKPAYIERIIKSTGLRIMKKGSVSWLRRTPLANLSRPLVKTIERLCQMISPFFMLAPSNWYVLSNQGKPLDRGIGTFESTLVDPATARPLGKKARHSCQQRAKHGVDYLDLRYPPFS